MPIVIPPPETEPLSGNFRELEINRKNTHAFIMADPIRLVLSHRSRNDTADGGWKFGVPVSRQEQVFRLIPQSDVMPQVQTPDGTTLTPGYVLLGEHFCLMERWDTFELNGIKFIIVSPIRPDYRVWSAAYERKADVARF